MPRISAIAVGPIASVASEALAEDRIAAS